MIRRECIRKRLVLIFLRRCDRDCATEQLIVGSRNLHNTASELLELLVFSRAVAERYVNIDVAGRALRRVGQEYPLDLGVRWNAHHAVRRSQRDAGSRNDMRVDRLQMARATLTNCRKKRRRCVQCGDWCSLERFGCHVTRLPRLVYATPSRMAPARNCLSSHSPNSY